MGVSSHSGIPWGSVRVSSHSDIPQGECGGKFSDIVDKLQHYGTTKAIYQF